MSSDQYLSLLHAYGCEPVEALQPTQVLLGTQRIHLQFVAGAPEEDDSRLMARIDVLQLPRAPSAQVCRTLLQANAFWSGIQGGALGLRGTRVVMLSVSQRLAALDADRLAVLLHGMAEDARRWAVFLQIPDTAKPQALHMPDALV